VIHRGRTLAFRVDTIERADGTRHQREIVEHPGAVAIIAIDAEDRVLLVRQFRTAVGRTLLEIPAGTLDVDPTTGAIEDPDLAARRELEEETGQRAGTWQKLGAFWTAPGFATELMHLYLATDLDLADDGRLVPDEDEALVAVRMPLADAVAAAEDGRIVDAKSIVGLLRVDRLRDRGGAEAAGSDQDAVTATDRITAGDMLRAMMILSRRSTGTLALGTILIGLGALNATLLSDLVIGIPAILLGLTFVSGLYCLPFIWYQLRKRRDLLSAPTTMVADRHGVTYTSATYDSKATWDMFKRVRELSGFVFLDTGMGANYFIPIRAFAAGDLERFRKLVADAGFVQDGRRIDRA
jgi:8-oxo-dGTP pyrophosphatase MutT (NUDIX family)